MTAQLAALRGDLVAERQRINGRGPAAGVPVGDLGRAERLVAEHGHRLRYVRETRRWLVFDGDRWRADMTGDAERAAKDTARGLLDAAARIEDPEQRERAAKEAVRALAEPRIRAMLTLAETEPGIATAVAELDRDPYLLDCQNGTLDLRTGELRAHDPADLITRGTDVAYDPAAAAPRWQRFLAEVFDGDGELIAFVHRLVGYALTGDTREHTLAVLHGTGANGKSTAVEVLKLLLGDLAATAAFDTFARSQGDHGPRNDLARLRGARLVTASESGEGRRLDEATVKEVTGGDTIAARFLYGEHFEFRPTFKLLLVTNHRPRVDGDDDAIWRRLRLIPFETSFQGREDRHLAATLRAELPGILAWAVEGCLAWQGDGLGNASAVTAATRSYRADEDHLGAFLADRCQPSGAVAASDLRAAYEAYCAEAGERPLGGVALGQRLARRGIHAKRGAKGSRIYVGVTLDRVTEGDGRIGNLPRARA